MVHAQVVRHTYGPGQELALLGIAAIFHGLNDLQEGILKNILGEILILHHHEYGGIYLVFIPVDNYLKGIVVTMRIGMDQLGI